MHASPTSKVNSAEFIMLSAASMALTALGIDIMLPAFVELRSYFNLGSESTATAQIISFFFMGQIAQIIFGPLSDRFGRLAILRIGFPLYIVGGLAAAYAPTLPIMLAARFIAGMGASAVFTATIAGVRDRFVGNEMARIMSFILTIFLFTPVIAPFLGTGILAITSWRIVFLTPPIFAGVVFLWSLRLDESLPHTSRSHVRGSQMLSEVKRVLSNRIFLRYVAITTILFTAFSAYIASSERIVSEIYGQPKLFPWIFAGIGAVMAMFTLLNSHLSTRFGAARALRRLLAAYVVIAGGLLVATLFVGDPPVMVFFFIAIALLTGINVAIEPNSSALALEPMGSTAGLAASIYGTSFFFVGASLGTLISSSLVTGVLPLIKSFFAIGVVTLILAYTDRR